MRRSRPTTAATRASAADADRAVELGRGPGDFRIWGEAALIRARVELDGTRPDPFPLREFLTAAGEPEPAIRAQIHVRLSELAFDKLQLDESATHAATAQDIAHEIDDPSILARVEFAAGLEKFGALDRPATDTSPGASSTPVAPTTR